MPVPYQLPTQARDAAYAGLTFHIQGELVPVLLLELVGMPIYFEHHILLWKDPTVNIDIKPLGGVFKRMLAGMPIIMTEARGPGKIAFSRDGVGQVIALPLGRGQALDVREHQFMAASSNVEFSYTWNKGFANILFGGVGFFIDTFTCMDEQGILFLHGYGNVFEVQLGPGEMIDVEPGGWIYKDPSVRMETKYQGLKTGFLASAGQLAWNRFYGPGKLGIQSMYMPIWGGGSEAAADNAGGNIAGQAIGAIFRGLSRD